MTLLVLVAFRLFVDEGEGVGLLGTEHAGEDELGHAGKGNSLFIGGAYLRHRFLGRRTLFS